MPAAQHSKDENEREEEPFDIDPGNEDPGSQLDRDATVPLLDPEALPKP